MRKIVLALFLLCLTVRAFGADRDPRVPFCRIAVQHQLDRWDKTRSWRAAAAEPGSSLYLSPTARLGEWLELRTGRSLVELRRVSIERRETVRYQDARCQAQVAIERPHYSAARLKGAFTDERFRTLVRQHGAGIVYSWSPHMPLSIERVQAIREAGKQLGLPVFYVLDPHADRELAQSTAREYGLDAEALRPMESIELFNRGMLQHYPSVLVFAEGKVRGNLIPGWKHEATYVSWVQERLSE